MIRSAEVCGSAGLFNVLGYRELISPTFYFLFRLQLFYSLPVSVFRELLLYLVS